MEKIKTFARKLRAVFNIIKLRTFLKHIEFEVVEHCNLNCKGCSHFSNICEQKFIDVGILGRHFDRLNKLFGFIYSICILGGEPLLHPDIIDIIEYTRRKFPISQIRIVTNGLLLDKMPEDFFKACHKNNILIYISKYPPVTNKIKEIKKILSEFKVKHFISATIRTFSAKLNSKGDSNKDISFKDCRHRECVMLKDDKIYICPIAAYINKYNKYFNKNISEPKGINIYSSSVKQIIDYLKTPEETCKYCMVIPGYIDWTCSKKAEENDWYGIQNGKETE